MCGNNAIYVLCLLFEKDYSISYGDSQVDLFFFALAFLKKCKRIILRTCWNLFYCVSFFFLMKEGFQFSLKIPVNHFPPVFDLIPQSRSLARHWGADGLFKK